MSKVRVALIGYGHLGKWHAQKANQLESSELVAIVEPYEQNQKAAKEAYPNVKVVSDIKEILSDIDTALIVTPTSLHFEMLKILLKNDKNIFCEKPVCSNYAEVKELESLLGNKVIQVGHSERCHEIWPEFIHCMKEITSKKCIKIDRFAPFKGRATDVDVVSDLMIHDLDLLLYLFNQKPIKLKSIGHKIRTDKWDHVTSHFTFENGDEAIITSGRNHVREVRQVEVMSDNGCVAVDLFTNEFLVAPKDKFEDESFVSNKTYNKRDHLLIEQESFYDSIINQKTPMVTFEDGANAVYLVSKVLESLETNKELTLSYEL